MSEVNTDTVDAIADRLAEAIEAGQPLAETIVREVRMAGLIDMIIVTPVVVGLTALLVLLVRQALHQAREGEGDIAFFLGIFSVLTAFIDLMVVGLLASALTRYLAPTYFLLSKIFSCGG